MPVGEGLGVHGGKWGSAPYLKHPLLPLAQVRSLHKLFILTFWCIMDVPEQLNLGFISNHVGIFSASHFSRGGCRAPDVRTIAYGLLDTLEPQLLGRLY